MFLTKLLILIIYILACISAGKTTLIGYCSKQQEEKKDLSFL